CLFKAAVTEHFSPTKTLLPPASEKSFVLKKIMDIPPPNILEEGDDEIEKEKLSSSEDVEGGGAAAPSTGGGSGTGGVSASLTPAIWEKTIPYDGENFHLEYMDLDEFLLENGIPVTLEEEEQLQKSTAGKGKSVPKVTASAAASQAPGEAQPFTHVPAALTGRNSEERNTPSPIDPEAIEVDINFQPDPTDLVLSSVPGGGAVQPTQPMIKKPRKERRTTWRPNVLANARRLKENQITVRRLLPGTGKTLRCWQQVAELRKDCGRCKNILARYEAK
uniref:TEF transcription factor, PAR bZIP family member b n=1 Tax=Takifugu rubripes TaxID=31033 RepID=A0A674NM28_TAKRU